MIKILQKLSLSLLLLNLFSCHAWKTSVDRLQTECAIDPQSLSEGMKVIKLVDTDGHELDSASKATLKARWEHQAQRSGLALTQKACLLVEATEGIVSIQTLSPARALAVKLDSLDQYSEVTLRDPVPVSIDLSCPAEGRFSQHTIPNPLRVGDDAQDLSYVSYRVELQREGDPQSSLTLLKRDFGETQSIPTAFDVRSLPEGVYQMNVSLSDLSQTWEPGENTAVASCPYAILHSPPRFSSDSLALDGRREGIYAQNSEIPLRADARNAQVYSCREKRAADYDEMESAASGCAPQGLCSKEEAFIPVDRVVAAEAGVHDFFVYVRDKAGNQSETRCHRAFVTATPPQVQLLWKKPAYNKTAAALEAPEVLLDAQIQVRHANLSDAKIKESLLCKVDFLVGGRTVRDGKDVFCTKGRCQGQSLGDFAPCDPDLQLSLGRAIEDPLVLRSILRLTVKVDDGAGHEDSAVRTLLIQRGAWDLRPREEKAFANFGLGTAETQDIYRTKDGRILARHPHIKFVSLWQGDDFQFLSPPETVPDSMPLSAIVKAQADIWGIWSGYRKPESTATDTEFAVLLGEQWQKVSIADWDQANDHCYTYQEGREGSLLCQSDRAVYRIQTSGSMERIAWPESLPEACRMTEALRDSAHGLLLACGSKLYEHRIGWREIPMPLPAAWPVAEPEFAVQATIDSSWVDSKGRYWFQLQSKPWAELLIGFYDNGGVRFVGAPYTYSRGITQESFAEAPNGNVLFGAYAYLEDQQRWLLLEDLSIAFQSSALQSFQDGDGRLWTMTDGFLLGHDGDQRRVLPLKGLGFAKPKRKSSLLQDKDGSLWFVGEDGSQKSFLYQLKQRSWLYFDKEGTNLPEGWAVAAWRNAQDATEVHIQSAGTFRLSEEGWVQTSEEPKIQPGPFGQSIVPRAQGGYYSKSVFGVAFSADGWIWTATGPQGLPTEGHMSWEGGEEDAKGLAWFCRSGENRVLVADRSQGVVSQLPDWIEKDSCLYVGRQPQGMALLTHYRIYLSKGQGEGYEILSYRDFGVDTQTRIRRFISRDPRHIYVLDDDNVVWKLDLLQRSAEALSLPINAGREYFFDFQTDAKNRLYLISSTTVYRREEDRSWSVRLQHTDVRLDSGQNLLTFSHPVWIDADQRLWLSTSAQFLRMNLVE